MSTARRTHCRWGLAILFASLVTVLLLGSGCASQVLAKQIVSAPNRQGLPRELRDPKAVAMADATYAVSWRTKVGPPDAELVVGVIDPAAYNFTQTLEVTAADGKETATIKMNWLTEGKDGRPLPRILPPKGTLVLLHGILMSRESMYPWALYFAQEGYRVVLVDLRGHGRSTGRWLGFGAWEVADLTKVVDELEQRGLLVGKLGVFGVSYGGAIAIQWAAQDPRIVTVVGLAPFSDPQVAIPEFMRGFAPKRAAKLSDKTFAQAEAKAADLAGFRWQDVNVLDAMRRVKVPVLLFHGSRDAWIPPRHTELLAKVAPAGSRRGLTPDDDHMSLMVRFDLIGSPALAWFNQQLCGVPETGVTASVP